MPNKKNHTKKDDSSFMYPSLHASVLSALNGAISPQPTFHRRYSAKDASQVYETHIMGRFRCPNNNCTAHGWASKKIAITIREYPGNEYNALVFNQRCKRCEELGVLTLDIESYVDRVAYRLKRWAGVWAERPEYSEKKGLPHKSSLCEGCKIGVCKEGFD